MWRFELVDVVNFAIMISRLVTSPQLAPAPEKNMRIAVLLAVVLTAQVAEPSMQFRNGFQQTKIEVWVYCFDHGSWANNQRPLTLRPGETASISLHTGNFQVVAKANGQEDRNNRVLARGEVDRMLVTRLFSGKQGKRWGIVDDSTDDDSDDDD
jgi:hypothetical protein